MATESGFTIGCKDRNEQQRFLEPLSERGSAKNSSECRAGRKADLNSGQHARWIGSEREGSLRSRSPLFHQPLQMRAA